MVALVLLVVVTLIGLAAIRGTTMQQQMTSNFYDREASFQSAEAALRAGEAWVIANPTNTTNLRNCTTQQCIANPFDSGGATAAQIQSVPTSTFNAGALNVGQPQYVVEFMGNYTNPNSSVQQLSGCTTYGGCGSGNPNKYFRITARNGDPASTPERSTVTIQSLFRS
ncbi:PilX N-terminal domain-containing pilus assembly protein [Halothiobacillus sp. DCM-1]|uniref:pilus assembly PilX family protein n=1 Tax=Halothiobacillus sp. DCM-1 TaxID=3112558 RepID=UPI003248B04A